MSKTTFMISPPVNAKPDVYIELTGVGAVVADAQSFAAEREVAQHRADLVLGDHLVVDVELQRPDALAVLTHPFLGELDADDVGARRGTGAEMRFSGGMPRKL